MNATTIPDPSFTVGEMLCAGAGSNSWLYTTERRPGGSNAVWHYETNHLGRVVSVYCTSTIDGLLVSPGVAPPAPGLGPLYRALGRQAAALVVGFLGERPAITHATSGGVVYRYWVRDDCIVRVESSTGHRWYYEPGPVDRAEVLWMYPEAHRWRRAANGPGLVLPSGDEAYYDEAGQIESVKVAPARQRPGETPLEAFIRQRNDGYRHFPETRETARRLYETWRDVTAPGIPPLAPLVAAAGVPFAIV